MSKAGRINFTETVAASVSTAVLAWLFNCLFFITSLTVQCIDQGFLFFKDKYKHSELVCCDPLTQA